MDLIQAINTRRSIRRYKDKPLEKGLIEQILHAAQMAPSAGNLQARDFVVVTEKKIKERLAEAALDQSFIAEAPAAIVVCANLERSGRIYRARGEELYSIQDASASTMNMLLAAHSLGMGTCWVGAFYEEAVSKILGLPSSIRPIAIIPVGYPAETPRPTPRMEIEKVTHREKW